MRRLAFRDGNEDFFSYFFFKKFIYHKMLAQNINQGAPFCGRCIIILARVARRMRKNE